MASYQDIDSRLRTIEGLVLFLAKNMRGKVVVQSGLVDAQGNSQEKSFEGSLLEIYRLAQSEFGGVEANG